MDLKEITLKGMYWMNLVEDGAQWRTVVNTVIKLCARQKASNSLKSLTTFMSPKIVLFVKSVSGYYSSL
jgi:hypothetical protein